MYYVNIQGLSKREFKTMLESSNNLPNNDIERFGNCNNNEESSCPKPEDQPIGMSNIHADDARRVGGVLAGIGRGAGAILSGGQWGGENFTNGGCQCGQTPCTCGTREGFQPIFHEDEDEEEYGEETGGLFEGFSQTSTST